MAGPGGPPRLPIATTVFTRIFEWNEAHEHPFPDRSFARFHHARRPIGFVMVIVPTIYIMITGELPLVTIPYQM